MKNKRLWVLLVIFCSLCIFANYRNNNMYKILAIKAEYSFKKNNITQAQEYLEKSFELGLKDSKYRDLYVNSIINSPFDSTSQDKLLNFIKYPIDDTAKLKAESFLIDFKREINKKYPQNYITQTVYNQKVMRWSKIPITYGFVNSNGVPEYFIKEIENAFTKWEVATEHQLLFTKVDNNPNIIIEFNSDNPADINSGKYVVAYTVPELNVNFLKHTIIKFYLKDPNNVYYSKNQVYNTALHEIVHALGFMGHSSNKDDIMHSTKDSKSVMNDEREELTLADINTIKLLYKIKPDITNDSKPYGTYTSFLVMGSAEKVQRAKMDEAVSYIVKAPKLAGGYIDLADSYVANKDYEKAVKCLKKALKLADSNEIRAMIYYNLAVVYYYSNDLEKAQKYLLGALQLQDSEDSHYLLAEIDSKNGQIANAVKEYENLILRNPHNIEYTICLTNIYIREHKYFSARKVLKNYIKANPSDKDNKRLKSYGIVRLFL